MKGEKNVFINVSFYLIESRTNYNKIINSIVLDVCYLCNSISCALFARSLHSISILEMSAVFDK